MNAVAFPYIEEYEYLKVGIEEVLSEVFMLVVKGTTKEDYNSFKRSIEGRGCVVNSTALSEWNRANGLSKTKIYGQWNKEKDRLEFLLPEGRRYLSSGNRF